MKGRLSIFVLLAIMSLFTATSSYASFPIKKPPVAAVAPVTASNATTATASEEPTVAAEKPATIAAEKRSWMGKIFAKAKAAAIPEILYIIMAIFPLGWLAMGINDNFTGSKWLISLLLYILFYIPGLIYTLVMLPTYY
jgi:uncharacterized membrane protein YqaE (UPF0057 family)